MSRQLNDFLSLGTLGHSHLLAAAQKAFLLSGKEEDQEAAQGLIMTGARLLAMAWAAFPLNAPLAAELQKLSAQIPFLSSLFSPDALRIVTSVARQAQKEDDSVIHSLFMSGDYDTMSARLDKRAEKGDVLPAAKQAMLYHGVISNWEWLEHFIQRSVFPVEPQLAPLLLADVLLAGGKFREAVCLCSQMLVTHKLPGMRYRLATALAGAGDREKSLSVLGDVLRDFPMHTSALLLMDSLAFPTRRKARLEGKCLICIYSYNKSAELAQTLESVLASDLGSGVGDVSVRVLINGSEDDSLAVANAARKQFNGKMDVISLPVNVGAPAARNWLVDAANRDGVEWVVFLDDDVLVPADWLSGLASGVEEFPDAGVWGCRVGDAGSVSLTQHGDAFLLEADGTASPGRRLAFYASSSECMVPLQLGYRRYSATVTGCCHLFRRETLVGNKGFDLGFSPSQYDDLDSDMRLLLDGKPAAYLGDVGIKHLRVSQRICEQTEAARKQSENHQALLEDRHAGHLDRLFKIQRTFVQRDLEMKLSRLQQAGYLSTNS